MRRALALAVLALVGILAGCGDDAPERAGEASGTVILASTTSTRDTGLLDALVPAFEQTSACSVKTLAVGSGQAIELGERQQADVLLVHSPKAEQELMDAGHGISRLPVMSNDFVLAGPPSDPAGIEGGSAADALTAIARQEAVFASRGDESGTHTKELGLWETTGIDPGGSWYIETGQGMAQTLRIASEKRAYTLSDSATVVTVKGLELEVLVEGAAGLGNPYHMIVVKGDKTNEGCARAFSDYVVGPGGQRLIGGFGVEEHGRRLFVPETPQG